jgi:hypothetical protein
MTLRADRDSARAVVKILQDKNDALLAALAWIAEHDSEFGDIEDTETMVANITSRAANALKAVQSA